MTKDTRRKWKHHRIVCVPAAKVKDANDYFLSHGWGPDCVSIPVYNPSNKKIKEYYADVVCNDEMLEVLKNAPANIFKQSDVEIPTTKSKGSAKLVEIAAKRSGDLAPAKAKL